MCRKTKMCRFFTKDACTYGDGCNFAHGEKELAPVPNLRQTKVCRQFKVFGRCLDLKCTFAHSEHRVKCAGNGSVGNMPVPMNSDVAMQKDSSTNQLKQQEEVQRQQQLVYVAYSATASGIQTGQRTPSPIASVDSGSNVSTTTASMNEAIKGIFLSDAIDTETTWEPLEDSPGQVASGEDKDLPDVLLPWGRSVTAPDDPTRSGRLILAPDRLDAEVCVKNTFLEIDFKEPLSLHRACSAPPAPFHVSEQEATGQKRTLVASPWGVLRPSSRPPRAKGQQIMRLQQLQGGILPNLTRPSKKLALVTVDSEQTPNHGNLK